MIIELIKLDSQGRDKKVIDRVTCNPGQAFQFETGRAATIFKARQAALGGVQAATDSLQSWSNGYLRTQQVPSS